MKTILITGGAGFIGSSLADKLLLKSNKIVVIDNFDPFYDRKIKEQNTALAQSNPNYILFECDITDKQSLNLVFEKYKFDVVIHLAAKAGVRPSIENPQGYLNTNVLGTLNILDAMKNNNIKKMVFASSSSIYGNCSAQIFSENLFVNQPISPYAATKSSGEQFCYTYSKLYGLNIVCLRFFTVYGPRQRPDLAINKFVRLISENKPIPVYGDGTTKRDYTFIDDIVSGICAAVDYNKTSYEIINLGGGEPITLNAMIQTIEEVMSAKAIIDRLPMQQGDVEKTICDYSKAQKLLGYNPQTTFKNGIKKFIEWRRHETI